MKVGIVGCGYVADQYLFTSRNHPELQIVTAFDRDSMRRETFCRQFGLVECESLDAMAADAGIELILNLTDPRSHFAVTRQFLRSGKHVYSEKPLAMTVEEARELVEVSRSVGRLLSSAPCSVLGPPAQAAWREIRAGSIGTVRVVHANFDDGVLPEVSKPWNWSNSLGVPWPAKDEFEIGCTFEHAGYVLTWLNAYFGPVTHVTSFAKCLFPDKAIEVDAMAPDFVVGCLEFEGPVVVRFSCSLAMPKDHSLEILGDRGVLTVADVRDERSAPRIRELPADRVSAAVERRVRSWRQRLGMKPRARQWVRERPVKQGSEPRRTFAGRSKFVDFCRGPAELVRAVAEQRAPRLGADLGVHLVEVVRALQFPAPGAGRVEIRSRFSPIAPLDEG